MPESLAKRAHQVLLVSAGYDGFQITGKGNRSLKKNVLMYLFFLRTSVWNV